MAGIDYESDYHNDEWVDWIRSDEPVDEPRLIVRMESTDPMAKIGRLALPIMTLQLLVIGVGSVVVALWEAARPVVLIGGAVFFAGRWLWRLAAGYSRGRG